MRGLEGEIFQLHVVGLNFRKIQQVVDDVQQGHAGAVDFLDVVPLLRREVGIQGQIGHAHDAVHGRADFVAHIGQENAFGGIGRLCLVLGLAQHALVQAMFRDVVGIARDAAVLPGPHDLIGQLEPTLAQSGMQHTHLGMFVPSHHPVPRTPQKPPGFTVLGHKARFHRIHALFIAKAFRQTQLAEKNVVAREFQLPFAVPQLEHAEPPQAAGQGKPRQTLPQGLVHGLNLADVLMVAGDPHQRIVVRGNAAAAATHENHAHLG